MSHPATTQFFDGLRASRLLDDARIDELRARPEAEWGDVVGLSNYALERGWLTAYQAREIEAGRAALLAVGGYRLLDKLADGPAGVTYKARHPSLLEPVSLRLLRPDWLAPADTPAEYVSRTQAATLVQNPHLATVLDAGTLDSGPYVVQEYIDGCDLFRLVNETGALPVGVACEYVRQAATAVKAAHEKGVVHGEVSPHTLVIAPVQRAGGANGDIAIHPLPGASVKLVELGLGPKRPAAGDLTYGEGDKLGPVGFLPPERLTAGDRTPAGDAYGLGATLYFLVTTRPPYDGSSPVEVMLNLQQAEPTPLDTLKPDVPAAVAFLVRTLLSRDPVVRPTAAAVVETLAPYCDDAVKPTPVPVPLLASETFTQPGVPTAVPIARDLDRPAPATEPFAEPVASESSVALGVPTNRPLVEPMSERNLPQVEPMEGGGSSEHLGAFGHTAMGADQPRAPRPKVKATGKNKAMLIGGLILHLIATIMILMFCGVLPNPFSSKPTQDNPPPKVQKNKDKKKGEGHQ